MTINFSRGSLNFNKDAKGGFVCQEMVELSKVFESTYASHDGLLGDIEARIDRFRKWFQVRFASKEERDQVPEAERHEQGAKIFDEVLLSVRQRLEGRNSMEQFMFWLSDWWYYNTDMRRQLSSGSSAEWIYENNTALVQKYILPILPEQVRKSVARADSTNITVGHGHFAILFVFKNEQLRRIVTDTQLFELHGVSGYMYLDVTPEGKPIARCCCDSGGERAFFDGVHLMSHDRFQTCAPKTTMINGGYKVNSTRCTIVNGMLFDLIDVDDKVAQTTGAFMGMCNFTNSDALASYVLAEESGKLMRVENDVVVLNNEPVLPIGVFLPSRVKLLESGFALYDWSDYEKISHVQYESVLVVDDNQAWLDQVSAQFGQKVKDLQLHLTSDKHSALTAILAMNPKALLLDMHLTSEEEFDGLWIARSLIKVGFKGTIMVASGYPEEHLRAMRTLINAPVHTPGKNLERVQKCLTDECDCKRR